MSSQIPLTLSLSSFCLLYFRGIITPAHEAFTLARPGLLFPSLLSPLALGLPLPISQRSQGISGADG